MLGALGLAGRRAQGSDGEVADQVAVVVGHRGERHTSRVRDATGKHAVEVPTGAWTGEPELREAGGLEQADAAPHGTRLFTYLVPGVRTAEGDLLDRLLTLLLEPEGGFEAIAIAEHRVLGDEPVVDR